MFAATRTDFKRRQQVHSASEPWTVERVHWRKDAPLNEKECACCRLTRTVAIDDRRYELMAGAASGAPDP